MKKLFWALIPLSYLVLLLFQTDLAMLGDLGRHIKLGEIIINCGCVPQTNLFSYTNPTFPIVNHEWLGEVIFYLIFSAFGTTGLLLFKMLIVVASATLLYLVALKKGSLFWVTLFAMLGITIFSLRFFVLPELFSYFFLALFVFFLARTSKNHKPLWLLPLLEVLWVNSHIYFILGLMLYGFFLLETFIKNKRVDKKLLIIGSLLLLATLCNPSGLRGALLPFTFSTNYGLTVEENTSPLTIFNPNSTNANLAYTLVLQVGVFEVLVGLFVLCLVVNTRRKEIATTGAGLMSGLLGLKYTRCISLFGLLGFIPLAQTFTQLEEKMKKSMEDSMRNIIKGFLVLIVAIVIGIHMKGLFDYKILNFGFTPSAENAALFIKQNNIHGRFFNNYVIGNYLILALYPKDQVYIDARPEAYPASFFSQYWDMMANETFFKSQVEKYHINAVVFNVAVDDPVKIRPFLIRLLHDPTWVPVYADGTVTILVKNDSSNKAVIDKYRIAVPQ